MTVVKSGDHSQEDGNLRAFDEFRLSVLARKSVAAIVCDWQIPRQDLNARI
jgi:hypothetical protein